MSELHTYETVVAEQGAGARLRRIAWILGYVFFFSLFIVLSATQGLSFPILTLGALATGGVVLFTWKYTGIEYEYSLVGNQLSVAKIYGKRKRKPLLEIDLKRARLIAPCTEEYRKEAEGMSPTQVTQAISKEDAPNRWLILWDDEEDDTLVLIFEANDRLLSALRRENPRAIPREVKISVGS